jgi:hypothetical protein
MVVILSYLECNLTAAPRPGREMMTGKLTLYAREDVWVAQEITSTLN